MLLGAMNDPKKDLKKEIEWIKKSFDFIDLTIENPMEIDERKLKTWIGGFPVVGHTDWSLPIASPYEKIRKAAVEKIKDDIKIFSRLKCEYVNVHPNVDPRARENTILFHQESLKALMDFSSKFGLKIILENMPDFSLKEMTEISKKLPSLNFNFDVAHAFISKDLEKIIAKFHSKIVHLHLSDNQGLMDEHLPLGIGKIDWIKVVKLLKKYKYDRTITLEVHTAKNHALFSKVILAKIWVTV